MPIGSRKSNWRISPGCTGLCLRLLMVFHGVPGRGLCVRSACLARLALACRRSNQKSTRSGEADSSGRMPQSKDYFLDSHNLVVAESHDGVANKSAITTTYIAIRRHWSTGPIFFCDVASQLINLLPIVIF